MPPKTEMPSGEAKHRFNSSWLLTLSGFPGRQIAKRNNPCITMPIKSHHFRPRRQRRLWETN